MADGETGNGEMEGGAPRFPACRARGEAQRATFVYGPQRGKKVSLSRLVKRLTLPPSEFMI